MTASFMNTEAGRPPLQCYACKVCLLAPRETDIVSQLGEILIA